MSTVELYSICVWIKTVYVFNGGNDITDATGAMLDIFSI
jgi:hypothetical protein